MSHRRDRDDNFVNDRLRNPRFLTESQGQAALQAADYGRVNIAELRRRAQRHEMLQMEREEREAEREAEQMRLQPTQQTQRQSQVPLSQQVRQRLYNSAASTQSSQPIVIDERYDDQHQARQQADYERRRRGCRRSLLEGRLRGLVDEDAWNETAIDRIRGYIMNIEKSIRDIEPQLNNPNTRDDDETYELEYDLAESKNVLEDNRRALEDRYELRRTLAARMDAVMRQIFEMRGEADTASAAGEFSAIGRVAGRKVGGTTGGVLGGLIGSVADNIYSNSKYARAPKHDVLRTVGKYAGRAADGADGQELGEAIGGLVDTFLPIP